MASLSFFLLFQFIPPPPGLNKLSMQVIGIFIGTVILWLTVSIDWPSMLCVAAVAALGITNVNELMSQFFGNSTVLFLVFSYMLAYALTESGILRRFALWFISKKATKSRPWVLISLLMMAALIISLVIVPSTMILILMPILLALFQQCGLQEGDKLPEAIVLLVAFVGSIGQGMTPIGHAHPVIALSVLGQITGYEISYADFMVFAIPTGLITILVMFLFFRYGLKLDTSPFYKAEVGDIREELGPITKKEITTLVIFTLVIICWLAPTILEFAAPEFAGILSSLGNVYPPLAGSVLLFMIDIDGKPICDFKMAVTNGVPWGIVFLLGSTVVLSSALTSDQTCITAWVGSLISSGAENLSPFTFRLFVVLAAVVLTNFSSNAVTASIVTSITVPVALLMPEMINPYAITMVIASAVNYAFATPLATAVVAIAAGSGWVSTKAMAKYGTVIGIAGILILALIGYPIADLVLPYGS